MHWSFIRASRRPYLKCQSGLESHLKVELCLVAQLCLTLCNSTDCSPPGSSVHGDSIGKNTGMGCHALLQGIVPTQGSNPGLPYCEQILYRLSHQGSQKVQLRRIDSQVDVVTGRTRFSKACWPDGLSS